MAFVKKLTPEQAFQKARHYCGYQERSHSEGEGKTLFVRAMENGCGDFVIKTIEENYLNEEPVCTAICRGKFRMKQWGRIKIKHELKQKQVSEYCIKKAMTEIRRGGIYESAAEIGGTKVKSVKGAGCQQVHKAWKNYRFFAAERL
jgi:regulatory protein